MVPLPNKPSIEATSREDAKTTIWPLTMTVENKTQQRLPGHDWNPRHRPTWVNARRPAASAELLHGVTWLPTVAQKESVRNDWDSFYCAHSGYILVENSTFSFAWWCHCGAHSPPLPGPFGPTARERCNELGFLIFHFPSAQEKRHGTEIRLTGSARTTRLVGLADPLTWPTSKLCTGAWRLKLLKVAASEWRRWFMAGVLHTMERKVGSWGRSSTSKSQLKCS